MKKAFCLFSVMLIFCLFTVQVFAGDEGLVNEAERRVIDSIEEVFFITEGQTMETKDRKMFENYFKTEDISDTESDKAIEQLSAGIEYLKNRKTADFSALSSEEKIQFWKYIDESADYIGLTLTFTADGKTEVRQSVTSQLVYKQEQVIKVTGGTDYYIFFGVAAVLAVMLFVTVRTRKVSDKYE